MIFVGLTLVGLIGMTGCSSGDAGQGDGLDAGVEGEWLDSSLPEGDAVSRGSELECMRAVGGEGTNELHQMIVDADGNAIVAGRFQGTIDFGRGPHRSNGGFDLFVAMFDASCEVAWAVTAGGPGADLARDPSIGPDGHILITGHISDWVELAGRTLDAGDDRALLLAKISPQGRVVWAHHEAGQGAISGSYATHDADGNILAVAELRGDSDFVGGKTVERSTVDRNLIAFSSGGERLWETRWYGEGANFVTGVEVGDDGRIFAVGEFRGGLDFGDGERTSRGGADLFVAAVRPGGELDWVQTFGGPGDDFAASMTLGDKGDIIVAGGFSDAIDMGDYKLRSNGYLDGLLARLTPDGQVRWARGFGGEGYDRNFFVTRGARGQIVTAARFQERVEWAGRAFESGGVDDVVASVVSEDGAQVRWARQFGNEMQDVWYQLGSPDDGSLVISGGYRGSLELYGESLVERDAETFYVVRVGAGSDG
ncbi:hypothetical protein FIV42_26045 [Persicimonas caeni]|uniref:PQQ-like beta-propeller repeat protein n=1 Tax=Persicimonas caeni TaxID=2292766 RepID=A0A4Y6Q1L7_PERCE|nr:hypothetical protein [Persicimonas caeni]QDG54077.1 hypothetical protein FIV42_26045 [Persicimonas caeni]QED35298.1 hypothetical protein FRD00_26040 [Persicimonas caeni]